MTAVAQLPVCSVCGAVAEHFDAGPGGQRPEATCPACGSLERHRFLVGLLLSIAREVMRGGALLDTAPSACLTSTISAVAGSKAIRMDLDPHADARAVDIAADLTSLPLADDAVDVLIAYHVLEHIPDDAAAMREVARTLAPGGVAFIQVPWRAGPTDEDPDADVEERIRRFGRADHVRYYGDDFEQRLNASGLRTRVVTPADVLPPWTIEQLRLMPHEKVWLCSRADAPEPSAVAEFDDQWPTTMRNLLGIVAACSHDHACALADGRAQIKMLQTKVAKLRRANRRLRLQRNRWRRRYRQLQRKPLVKAALRVTELLSRK